MTGRLGRVQPLTTGRHVLLESLPNYGREESPARRGPPGGTHNFNPYYGMREAGFETTTFGSEADAFYTAATRATGDRSHDCSPR